jgi:hypothetical protein
MADNVAVPFPHPRPYLTQTEVLLHKDTIKGLEEDISDLEDEITSLKARLQHLQQKNANHSSYISPLRCLPPDLLSEIVEICL